MKIKAAELAAIRLMLDDDANLDPSSWKYYAEILLTALDDVLDRLAAMNEYL